MALCNLFFFLFRLYIPIRALWCFFFLKNMETKHFSNFEKTLVFPYGLTISEILGIAPPFCEMWKNTKKTEKTDEAQNLKSSQTIRKTGVFAKWQKSEKQINKQKKRKILNWRLLSICLWLLACFFDFGHFENTPVFLMVWPLVNFYT